MIVILGRNLFFDFAFLNRTVWQMSWHIKNTLKDMFAIKQERIFQ